MMKTMNKRRLQLRMGVLGGLTPAVLFFANAALADGCPSGASELLPNLRALPPTDIAMLDADNMQFSSTSWNAGDGDFVLVARDPVTDPSTGEQKQPVDQLIYCSDGSSYTRSAGFTEYHPEHKHVHYDGYAKYILEPDDASNSQNPRQGDKTSFCIMDTTSVNTQLIGASPSAVFSWCPTQDPNFRTQGMSIGWGDTYGSNLPGQSLYIGDLPGGMYRLRHIFDPYDRIKETDEADNESCKRVEIGDGPNGRYVADRGLCNPPPAAQISSISPVSASQNSCVAATIAGNNLIPEMNLAFFGGTGPLVTATNTSFDLAGDLVNATVCVAKARGGKKAQLGKDPVWDVYLGDISRGLGSASLPDSFTVTP